MNNYLNRIGLFLSRILFSLITPVLLMPGVGKTKTVRSIVAFCFGRSYGDQYPRIIDSFKGLYGTPMDKGLTMAKEILGDKVFWVLDCGTGTGFVTRQAAERFPGAGFIAFDILPGMLRQADANCQDIADRVFHLQADTFALPLPDESVDLILAQNTMPCFTEFARVCRPGGVILYVDSSSGWITQKVKRQVAAYQLFKQVTGEQVDMGFCIVAVKEGDFEPGTGVMEGETKQEKLANLMRCPVDKSRIQFDGRYFCCEFHHQFPVHEGFPVMIAGKAISERK